MLPEPPRKMLLPEPPTSGPRRATVRMFHNGPMMISGKVLRDDSRSVTIECARGLRHTAHGDNVQRHY